MRTLAAVLIVVLAAGFAAGESTGLTVFMYSEYIDPAIPKQFTATTGTPVTIDVYEESEEMLGKLKAGGSGQYDVIIASDFVIPALIALKLVRPLDLAKVANAANVAPAFQKPPFDPDGRYSLPYQWGTDGIIYRTDQVSGPISWSLLIDPARQPGPFYLLDTARDQLGIALLLAGKSMNSRLPAYVAAAGEALVRAKQAKKCLGFSGGVAGKNKVAAGEAVAAIVYNGDAVKAMAETPGLGFAIPIEGSTLTTDCMLISAKSANPDAAHAFINHILDAKVGAQLSNFNRYATPNAAAMPFIDAKDRANPAIYPPPEMMRKLERLSDLGKDNRLYEEVWGAVKSR